MKTIHLNTLIENRVNKEKKNEVLLKANIAKKNKKTKMIINGIK